MKIFILLALLIPAGAMAQGTCSATTPCYQVTITNGNSLPATTVVWRCMGDVNGCSASALNDAIKLQVAGGCGNVPSTWSCSTFSQVNPLAKWNDPVKYGALMNFAASGGGAPGPTNIIIFKVPNQAKMLTISGSSQLTLSGNQGLQ